MVQKGSSTLTSSSPLGITNRGRIRTWSRSVDHPNSVDPGSNPGLRLEPGRARGGNEPDRQGGRRVRDVGAPASGLALPSSKLVLKLRGRRLGGATDRTLGVEVWGSGCDARHTQSRR